MIWDPNGIMWDRIQGTGYQKPEWWISNYQSGGCCGNNHVFLYTNAPTDGEVPEGMSCSCGLYAAAYENCPTCGNRCLMLKHR